MDCQISGRCPETDGGHCDEEQRKPTEDPEETLEPERSQQVDPVYDHRYATPVDG